MIKIISCLAAMLCLLTVVAAPCARGQTISPAAFAPDYSGVVVWQQADGATMRGIATLNLSRVSDHSKKRVLSAAFDFEPTDGSPAQTVYIRGKLEPNGVGSMRVNAGSIEDLGQTVPKLDPGRVAVFISPRGYATGGALAEDGTQLTFRVFTTSQAGATGQ